MCDHPDASFADYVNATLRPTIDRFGWAVQAVGGTRLHAPFSYTVGLTARGLPERVVTGKPPEASAALLNAYALTDLEHGDQLDGLEVVDVPHPEAHLLVATSLYGEVTAQQLVWADALGRWPWARGHAGQPVLGPRAVRQPRAG